MAWTLGRRVGVLLVSLLASSVIVFGFMNILPGDPARVSLGVSATEESVAALRHDYGLDRPLIQQYLSWIQGLATGNLGHSYVSGDLIAPRLLDALAVTTWLVLTALLIALLIAVPTGTLMAIRRRHLDGAILTALSQLGVAIPAFLAAMLLVALLSVHWRLLPSSGWVAPSTNPIGFLRHLALPAFSLGLVQSAVLSRYLRSAVLDVLREDYLRTARAKGLTSAQALIRHGLRNAAVPVVTIVGIQLSAMLVGAVVIERVFVVHGIGSLLLDAVGARDLILVQDIVMTLVVIVLTVSFITDLLYTLLDPRFRDAS
ncbi:Dipeptide transport system permease protein DppB [Austwickia sp. TVS 96-490-7B]|uniref:ABC transporter permease n=1 Tax=Austwickia sp. TVS 96-490-7B TaxID=2830843 RepID=UPI001C5A0486|nr:ABC transporter permease [Austwickia sp. TVS 96-490-7B]MBW3086457.1 Dipeptide transport system permease protein DppB [Austwickia sp. TVS 96-490-7B]